MRTLVIGLDGASPQLVEKWIEDLPNFNRFKMKGQFGLSIPPAPAQTPVAWTTFMTGKNPGKHGIFSFAQRKAGSYERRIVRPNLIMSKTLWQILSSYGKKVGVINVPMSTYKEVNGFMIPGFLDRLEGIPQPREVKEKIRRKLGNLEKIRGDVETETLEKVSTDPDLFFKEVNEITDELAEVGLYLLEEEPWDFFVIVFMGTDRLQHFFWKYVDEDHPDYREDRYSGKVKDFYVKIDKILGKFLDTAPKNTLIILLSDHGFCFLQKEIIINNYLQEFGMLEVKNGKIDLKRSKAISYGFGDVWLNVKGREPKGKIEPSGEYEEVRNRIIEGLESLEVGGERPIKKVRKREEVYWGPYTDAAPDLMIFFNQGWQAARSPEIESKESTYIKVNPRWSGTHDGAHIPTDVPGILGFLGQGVHGGKEVKAYLWDMAPTILRIMDVPIPEDMDGKPLQVVKKKRSLRKFGKLFRR